THFLEAQHAVVEATAANHFMPTASDIRPHLNGTTLISLCSPQNPTGTTFTKEGLEEICDMVLAENAKRGPGEKKLYVLYDQMYWHLTYGDIKHYNPVSLRPAMKEYTVFIDAISKVFAATGVRVGWSMGPAAIINKMKAINSHLGAWAPMAEQKAVASFLFEKEKIDKYLLAFKSAVEKRLAAIHEGFQLLKTSGHKVDSIAPQAAIYLTIQLDLVGKTTAEGSVLKSQADVTAYILNEAKIAVVPFYAFGAPENSPWYRLSVGTCKFEEIEDMLAQLKTSLEKLK
ncbi:MAG TPA: aminotransferase class I/II-fold pyridoxal phosphate-dependent enzyme, partial [Flavitalea sp.]|nr:aminotransferase class I/II-fold pyridoxal phosphate-dependent enzyme [Flavitalea sp.]